MAVNFRRILLKKVDIYYRKEDNYLKSIRKFSGL
jgi:hypothetical protein